MAHDIERLAHDIERFFDLSVDMLCIAGLDGCFRHVNPAFERVLGWKEEDLPGRPFLQFVQPEDVPATQRELEKLASGVPEVSFENRYRCSDGSYKSLRWTVHREQGNGLLYSVARDISEFKRVQELFRLAIEASPSAMIMADSDGKIVLVNEETERLFGYGRDELLGRSIELLVPERFRRRHIDHREAFRAEPHPRPMGIGRELVALRRDGSEVAVEIGLNPISTPNGTYVLSTVLDITHRKRSEEKIREQARQLEQANKKLAELALTDALTGLQNRRAFLGQLEIHIRQALRNGRSLSVLLMDIDHFKKYNDSFGHPAGDELLRGLGRLLRLAARRSDFVGRYGGEEFAFVLPETDEEGALVLAERFRARIAKRKWPHRRVTASFGAATLSFSEKEAWEVSRWRDQIIAEADRALYHSKQNGRNRVTHAVGLDPA